MPNCECCNGPQAGGRAHVLMDCVSFLKLQTEGLKKDLQYHETVCQSELANANRLISEYRKALEKIAAFGCMKCKGWDCPSCVAKKALADKRNDEGKPSICLCGFCGTPTSMAGPCPKCDGKTTG